MFNLRYYCPTCNKIIPFWHTKKRSEFCGHYTNVWRMCLYCGEQNIITRTERLDELCSTKSINDDVILSVIKDLSNDYGSQGVFNILDKEFTTNELVTELETNTKYGIEFKKSLISLTANYLMEFRL